MVPTLNPGDVVFDTRIGSPAVGQVTTFHASGGKVVTHRLVSTGPSGLRTKGDANRTADPWRLSPRDLLGRVAAVIPKAGFVLVFLRQPTGLLSLLGFVWGLLLAWRLFLEPTPDRPRPVQAQTATLALIVPALAATVAAPHLITPSGAMFSDSRSGTIAGTRGHGQHGGDGAETCKEKKVLDSYSPKTSAKKPITSLPATLSVVYKDETPLNTTDQPPQVSIDGNTVSDAWDHTLTAPPPDGDRQTLTYTAQNDDPKLADETLHTIAITVHDSDGDGCGTATFYVQTASGGTTPPAETCKEKKVLDSYSPKTSAKKPITSLPATLSVVYKDETPLNTTDQPPQVSIDGSTVSDAWDHTLTAQPPDGDRQTLTYTAQNDDPKLADETLHTIAITVHDSDGDGCGTATFYVQTTTP